MHQTSSHACIYQMFVCETFGFQGAHDTTPSQPRREVERMARSPPGARTRNPCLRDALYLRPSCTVTRGRMTLTVARVQVEARRGVTWYLLAQIWADRQHPHTPHAACLPRNLTVASDTCPPLVPLNANTTWPSTPLAGRKFARRDCWPYRVARQRSRGCDGSVLDGSGGRNSAAPSVPPRNVARHRRYRAGWTAVRCRAASRDWHRSG